MKPRRFVVEVEMLERRATAARRRYMAIERGSDEGSARDARRLTAAWRAMVVAETAATVALDAALAREADILWGDA